MTSTVDPLAGSYLIEALTADIERRVHEEIVRRAREHLGELRARRDAGAVDRARDALRRGARGHDDLFPLVLAAVEAEVTLGEISDDLRSVFGTYSPRG